jgi:Pyruvate/2-oxoacid:ferredoxin oxidoreductase delta subunit
VKSAIRAMNRFKRCVGCEVCVQQCGEWLLQCISALAMSPELQYYHCNEINCKVEQLSVL